MHIRTRRDFLRATLQSVTALGAAGSMAKFGEINALAAGGTGYQALVCIFLSGGNDGHNTVVPIGTAQQNYSLYAQGRGALALPQGTLLPIANGSDTYGLHPSLVEIQGLYNQGKAAVLANVGMLVEPITRAAYNANNTAIVPNALFSHSDQAAQWQSAIPNGIASSGWGGRITDQLQSQNMGPSFRPSQAFRTAAFFAPASRLSGDCASAAIRLARGHRHGHAERSAELSFHFVVHATTAHLRQRFTVGPGRQRHHHPGQLLR